MENLAKQLILIAQSILTFGDSQRIDHHLYRVEVRDVSQRLVHEAKTSEVAFLALDPLILSELEESSQEKLKSLRAAHTQHMIF
jgi:hypothetical protein